MQKILLTLLLTLSLCSTSHADFDDGVLPLLEGIAIGSLIPRGPPPPPVYYQPQGYYQPQVNYPPPAYYPPQGYYPPPQRVYVPVPGPIYYEPQYRYQGYEYEPERRERRRWDPD